MTIPSKHDEFYTGLGTIFAQYHGLYHLPDQGNEQSYTDPAAQSFARYLRAARRNAGLSEIELAEKVKPGQTEDLYLVAAELFALEHGLIPSTEIRFETLTALANALEEDISDFASLLERELPTPETKTALTSLHNGYKAATAYFGSTKKLLLVLIIMVIGFAISMATVYVYISALTTPEVKHDGPSPIFANSNPPQTPGLIRASFIEPTLNSATNSSRWLLLSEMSIPSYFPAFLKQILTLTLESMNQIPAFSMVVLLFLLIIWIAILRGDIPLILASYSQKWQRRLVYITPLILMCVAVIAGYASISIIKLAELNKSQAQIYSLENRHSADSLGGVLYDNFAADVNVTNRLIITSTVEMGDKSPIPLYGSPWLDYRKSVERKFFNASRIALYTDFQGIAKITNFNNLSWQAHWYTPTMAADNLYHYTPKQPSITGIAWDQTNGINWMPSNSFVYFKRYDSSNTLIFSDTVSAGYLISGTYQVNAFYLGPKPISAYSLTVTVEPANRFIENDETNNKITQTYQLAFTPPHSVIATTFNSGQGITSSQVALNTLHYPSPDKVRTGRVYLLREETEKVINLGTPDDMGEVRLLRVTNGDTITAITYDYPSTIEKKFITVGTQGDYDGDGDLDLAIGNGSLFSNYPISQPIQLYRNDNGIFRLDWKSKEMDSTRDMVWGDYDSDGDLDLAVGNYGQNRLYQNDNGKLYSEAVWSFSEHDSTQSVAWGDYDSDGDLDLAVGNSDITMSDGSFKIAGQPNRVYQNDGLKRDGRPDFQLAWSSTEKIGTTSIAWEDYDSDGDLDLVAIDQTDTGKIYLNLNGELETVGDGPWTFDEAKLTTGVAWGDVDDEGFQSMCMTSTRAASDTLISPLPSLVVNAQHSNHASLGEWPVENISGLAANAAEQRLLLLGCHTGLSVSLPEEVDKRLTDLDLAEAWLSKGGLVIGSNANAYASRHEMAYSEIFAEQFLNRLLTGTVQLLGPTLIQTKQEYFSTRQASSYFDPLDTKVLLPMTLYGLPMRQVQTPQTNSSIPDPMMIAQSFTDGLVTSSPITSIMRPLGASLVLTTVQGEGQYYALRYQGRNHTFVRKGYPMQPTYSFNLPATDDGRVAHGVVLRSVTYHEEQSFDPVIADIWVLDEEPPTTFLEPAMEFTGWDHEHFYSFGAFTPFTAAVDSRSQAKLNLILGNYHRETQTERLFNDFTFEVLYSSATLTDFTAPVVMTPTAVNITGTGIANQVIINVQATDADSPIVAAVDVCDNGRAYHAMTMIDNGTSWSGVCQPDINRFYVQVIDAAGNVASSVWITKPELITLVPVAYLPVVTKDYTPPLPDLIVSKIVATENNITVAIRNIGEGNVSDDFWVDLHINPSSASSNINQIWTKLLSGKDYNLNLERDLSSWIETYYHLPDGIDTNIMNYRYDTNRPSDHRLAVRVWDEDRNQTIQFQLTRQKNSNTLQVLSPQRNSSKLDNDYVCLAFWSKETLWTEIWFAISRSILIASLFSIIGLVVVREGKMQLMLTQVRKPTTRAKDSE